MLRAVDVILICGLVGSAMWTYKVKYDAQVTMEQVVVLEKKIARERAEINLLKADWSLFNSPERLQRLVEKYHDDLNLNPLDPSQIATMDQLPPMRSERLEGVSSDGDGFAAIDGSIRTGSVRSRKKSKTGRAN